MQLTGFLDSLCTRADHCYRVTLAFQVARQELAGRRFIIHNQNQRGPAPSVRICSTDVSCQNFWLHFWNSPPRWQREAEATAFAQFALHADCSTLPLYQALSDSQSQPSSLLHVVSPACRNSSKINC